MHLGRRERAMTRIPNMRGSRGQGAWNSGVALPWHADFRGRVDGEARVHVFVVGFAAVAGVVGGAGGGLDGGEGQDV